MYSIVGSGFGLYGYLPAIIKLHGSKSVVLPEKYREKVLSRKELSGFDKDILWVKNSEDALAKATDLIMATPPSIQYSLVKQIVNETNIRSISLEKPIAPTADMSNDLLDFLDAHKVSYAIGYSFCYLNLQTKFDSMISAKQDIYWSWKFMAHHFSMNLNNWKRYHDTGGGVLRFYGVHIIAFLSTLGYKNIINSTLIEDNYNEPHTWEASISGDCLPICHVTLNCKSSKDVFDICNAKFGNMVSSKDPFNLITDDVGQLDRRVSILTKILNKDLYGQYKLKSVYKSINNLWKEVERVTKVINTR